MKNIGIVVLALFVSLTVVAPSSAAMITVENPSFESPALAEGGYTESAAGWTLGTVGTYGWRRVFDFADPSSLLFPTATDGQNIAVIKYHGVVKQDLAATLEANTTYTLTVDVGQYNGYPIPWQDNPGSGTYFGGRSGIYLGCDYPTGWSYGTLAGTKFNQVTFTEGGFTEVEIEFTTGDTHAWLGEELWIALYALGGLNSYAAFDNVRLEAVSTVPIPGAVWFLGTGLMCLVGLRKKRGSEG